MTLNALGHGDRRQASEQLFLEFRIELGADRRHPPVVRRKRPAFDGVFFRHQHRQILREAQIFRLEGMMIGKGMLDDPQPGMAQMIEKASWIANAGDRMDRGAPKTGQGGGNAGIGEIDSGIAAQAHQIFPPAGGAIADHEIHFPQPGRGFA